MTETQDVLNPAYWKERLETATAKELHHAVFCCGKDRWDTIENKHRQILAKLIKPTDSILDLGCGWGRLIGLLPPSEKLPPYDRLYCGVDLCQEFIDKAESLWKKTPGTSPYFFCQSIERACKSRNNFDWAIMISVRPMIVRNCGQETWDNMEKEIRKVAKKLLYLEYDPSDEGSVE